MIYDAQISDLPPNKFYHNMRNNLAERTYTDYDFAGSLAKQSISIHPIIHRDLN